MVSFPKESQTRRLIDGHAAADGLTLQYAVTVGQFATVMQCVQAGVGVAIVPGGAVPAATSAGLISRPLTEPVLTRSMGVIHLKDRGFTPSGRGFFEHIKEFWEKGGSSDV
jgi:DNA-binding transcriptional LysR family regulator